MILFYKASTYLDLQYMFLCQACTWTCNIYSYVRFLLWNTYVLGYVVYLSKAINTRPYVNQLSDVRSMSLSATHIPCTLRMGSVCDKPFCIVTGCRFLVQHCKTYSCDSVVNVATSYGTEAKGTIPAGGKIIFSFPKCPYQLWGAHPAPTPNNGHD